MSNFYNSLKDDDLPDIDFFNDDYYKNEIDKSIFNGEYINGPLSGVFDHSEIINSNIICPFLLNKKVNYNIAKYFIEKYKSFEDFNINHGYLTTYININNKFHIIHTKSELYLYCIKDNEIFELFLQNGADPNAFLIFDKYNNLLSSIEDIEKIKLLLKYGAIVENKLKLNNTVCTFNNFYMKRLNLDKLIIFLKNTKKEISEELIEFLYKNNKNKVKIKDRDDYSYLLKQTSHLKNKQLLFSLIEKN